MIPLYLRLCGIGAVVALTFAAGWLLRRAVMRDRVNVHGLRARGEE